MESHRSLNKNFTQSRKEITPLPQCKSATFDLRPSTFDLRPSLILERNNMKVSVAPYNTDWPRIYEAEANKLREVPGKQFVDIHHIGSTAVPGMPAKPVIDIMMLVWNIETVDACNEKFVRLGYEAMGEYGISGRRFFRKGDKTRTHHVHVFEANSSEAERHLAFRDYLIAHPDEALEYGQLKQRLAQRFPNDIEAYIDGKNDFIKELEQKALKWYK